MDLNATPTAAPWCKPWASARARRAARSRAPPRRRRTARSRRGRRALVEREKTILAANAQDVKAARAEGRDDAFIDRLTLTAKAIEAMAEGLREVAELPDPVGEITELAQRPSGIRWAACACRSA